MASIPALCTLAARFSRASFITLLCVHSTPVCHIVHCHLASCSLLNETSSAPDVEAELLGMLNTRMRRARRWLEGPVLPGGHDKAGLTSVSWSASGSHLLAAGSAGGLVLLYDLAEQPPGRVAGGAPPFLQLQGHSGAVNDVAFSPQDPSLLVSASDDSTLRLWKGVPSDSGSANNAGAPLVMVLQGHSAAVQCVAWSPILPNILLSSSNDTTIIIWNAAQGKVLQHLEDQGAGTVLYVAWHPSLSQVFASGSASGHVSIWQLGGNSSEPGSQDTFLQDNKVYTHAGEVAALAWLHSQGEATRLATSGHNPDPDDPDHVSFVWSGFLTDGYWGYTPYAWDEAGWVKSMAWCPTHAHAYLVRGLQGGSVVVADFIAEPDIESSPLAGGAFDHVLPGRAAAAENQIQLSSASLDGTLRLWTVQTDGRDAVIGLPVESGVPLEASWSPDGTRLAVITDSKESSLVIWGITPTREKILAFSSVSLQSAVAWAPANVSTTGPDAVVVATAIGQTVFLYNSEHLNGTWTTLEGHAPSGGGDDGSVLCLAWRASGGVLASGGADRRVLLWNPFTSSEPTVLDDGVTHGQGVHALAFSPVDERLLASGGGYQISLWDTGSGELVRTLWAHEGGVLSLAWSPTSARSFASGGKDNLIRVWSIRDGDDAVPNDSSNSVDSKVLRGHSDHVVSVSWARDNRGGTRLSSGSLDGRLRIWDPDQESPETIVLLDSFAGAPVRCAVFGPSGTSALATCSDAGAAVEVWPRLDHDSSDWAAILHGMHAGNTTLLRSDLLEWNLEEALSVLPHTSG